MLTPLLSGLRTTTRSLPSSSELVILKIPDDISVKFEKKTFLSMSPNFGVLQNFASSMRNYRFPDSCKASGVLYGDETRICKEGKKT